MLRYSWATIAYKEKRDEELGNSRRLGHKVDRANVTVKELFDDLLASKHGEAHYHYNLVINGGQTKDGKPFREHSGILGRYFGPMLAKDITVRTCQAYRKLRNGQGTQHTTINRELSKVSVAFRLGKKCGKVREMPPGGCDFLKKPETENTRRVRLPDKYYAFFVMLYRQTSVAST